ncbi:Transcriptional regulator, AraC family [hydrothermal vent metagenome]|uniref:Transcriptional regulator, AraC family n=1 Tax=hydrothermal vent metagenome TaxID=652676 RepID=A0A3B0WSL3_9ZZZZ
MKKTTSATYRQRFTAVIEYMHDNINGDLGVNALADIAIMSPYHFHRIYRELMQETVNATVRRLRLQKAAIDLIRTDQSIQSVAQGISYGSVEAFSRAFSRQFCISPGEYRNTKKHDCSNDEPFIAMLPAEQKRYDNMYEVKTISIDKIHLAGYSHKGDYMAIGSTFEKLYMNASSQNLLNENTRSIGLYYDDPKSVELDALRSVACISVDKSQALDGGLERMTIPAGSCASILFKGPYAELEKPYDWLMGHWIPNNNKEIADFPPFEEYLNNPRDTPPNELLTRIYCLLA